MNTKAKFGLITNSINKDFLWSIDDYVNDSGMPSCEATDYLPMEECEKLLKELQDYAASHGHVTEFNILPIPEAEEVDNVELYKGSYHEGDTLSWSWCGKDYSCTGEFYIDKQHNLHHTFITPLGNEIEIITPYE